MASRRTGGKRRNSSRSSNPTEVSEGLSPSSTDFSRPSLLLLRRQATVFDAVAGRLGPNGFLTQEQLKNDNVLPLAPEEVLLRRDNAPVKVSDKFYSADTKLDPNTPLPDSDLVKAVHTYASDFYTAITEDHGEVDFRSFDDSALLALGVLLEEASKEALGISGDMALVEPEGLENGLPETKLIKHQIIGRVKPRKPEEVIEAESESDSIEQEASPRKKRRG